MDSKFDNIIKAKLENMTSDATPRWDLFKEKKSALDAVRADKSFDNDIRRSLSDYTVPYNVSHWTLLKTRLENIYRLRKAIYSIKVYELLAILILFYGIGANYDYIFSIDQRMSEPIAALDVQDDLNSAAISNSVTRTEDIAVTDDLIPTSDNSSHSTLNKTIASRQIISEDNYMQSVYSDITNANTTDNIIQSTNTINGVSYQKTVNNQNTSDLIPAQSAFETDIVNIIPEVNSINAKTSSISWNENKVLIDNDFGIKPLHSTATDGKWLHVVASFDNNQITTPFNDVYNIEGPQSTEMYGYTLSGLFSVQKNNLEYETGLGYSLYNKPVSYRGAWDNNRGDVFIYSLTNISYDILSIPLRAKYHFVRNRDWSLFVTGGVSSEFIVSTGYDENNEKLNILAPTPQGPNQNPSPELTESPFRTDSNFHDGFFEGGSFRDNFMLRAQIGAGMERNITPTLSAYISGDFYTSLLNTTYGPTDDSINKFAITFGIKERF